METKGIWKKDPRGVDYVSFTMPDVSELEEAVEFGFKYKGEEFTIETTSSKKILGIIVLMNPKIEDED